MQTPIGKELEEEERRRKQSEIHAREVLHAGGYISVDRLLRKKPKPRKSISPLEKLEAVLRNQLGAEYDVVRNDASMGGAFPLLILCAGGDSIVVLG